MEDEPDKGGLTPYSCKDAIEIIRKKKRVQLKCARFYFIFALPAPLNKKNFLVLVDVVFFFVLSCARSCLPIF